MTETPDWAPLNVKVLACTDRNFRQELYVFYIVKFPHGVERCYHYQVKDPRGKTQDNWTQKNKLTDVFERVIVDEIIQDYLLDLTYKEVFGKVPGPQQSKASRASNLNGRSS